MSSPAAPACAARRQALARLLVGGGAAALAGPVATRQALPARPSVQVLRPDWQAMPAATTVPPWAAGRAVRLYLPPGYAVGQRRYPVIYLPDGQNLFDAAADVASTWGVDATMDALAASDGLEAIVVGIDHGGERRNRELSPWSHPRIGASEAAGYLDFVLGGVKPWVDGHWRTRPERDHTVMIGSSLGGLMAHWALHRRPDALSGAGVLSPSYWISDAVYAHTLAHPRPADARIFLYAGDSEGPGVVDDVQRMHQLLAGQSAAGLRLRIVQAARHDEAAWRAVFPLAVRWLLGAPPR